MRELPPEKSRRSDPVMRVMWKLPLTFVFMAVVRLLAASQDTSHLIASEPAFDFQMDVRPILSDACFECHGPDAETRQADLRLDDLASAEYVLKAGDASPAAMLDRLLSVDPDLQMPPPHARKQLTKRQKQTLQQWLKSGANYTGHWSFEPIRRPQVEKLEHDKWSANPIDVFVLKKLRSLGIEPAPQASPTTLARRLSLDLTGLPLQPKYLEDFLFRVKEFGLERACDDLVNLLMNSTAYAEQMTLPWLEAARYADTDGYQNDRYRYQHAWRDWVIKAFNEKMPYDQFVIEQLAGDMLPNATLWQQVATGFGRNHRINSEDGSIPDEWLAENVADRVDTFGTVFLGLTVGCARCHDHKYDPISHREYYQLFAYFNNIAEHGVGPNNGNSPPFVELPSSWPLLAENEDRAITPEPVKLHGARKTSGNGLKRPQAGPPETVMVMHELDEPRMTYRLIRGQYNMPDRSERLLPGVPKSLSIGKTTPADRLELASWLVDGQNPLTARVAVNRIWQQFFGVGLVESSENFGSQGALPSHPELLDWLASELMASGWSLQHIQKLILGSSTYRQSSDVETQHDGNPESKWLARGPRLRLSAFSLRDQALSVAGLLVNRSGGPSVKPYMPEKIWSAFSNNKYEQDSGENLFRRSVYTYWRRTIPPPTMVNFNAAAREVCIVRTESTNTPLQALTLLNNKTFVEAARCLAYRMKTEGGSQLASQLDFAIRQTLLRTASQYELDLLTEAHRHFLADYEAHLESARALLAIGEFQARAPLDPAEHAALTLTASLILNLDETITKE